MSTATFILVCAVGAFGFMCLLALIFLCACSLAARDDRERDVELYGRRRLGMDEVRARCETRPHGGVVASSTISAPRVRR